MFEILLSADAFVPDHAAAVRIASAELGIRLVDERRFVRAADQRAEWSFSRVHPDRRVAPTMLEFLAPLDRDEPVTRASDYAYIPEIAAAQGRRPARLHSTPVGVSDIGALADQLASRGLPFRLDAASALLPFQRLWVGFDSTAPATYRPDADGGVHLEFVPFDVLGLPPAVPLTRLDVADGAPVRISARTLIVDDISDTLHRLDTNFGWCPGDAVSRQSDGTLRARLDFSYPRSAVIELIQPGCDASGYEADFARRYGAGACAIRFEVIGLEHVRERLESLGSEIWEAQGVDGRQRLVRPADAALGTAFEFAECDTGSSVDQLEAHRASAN